ncbi:MAG: dTMP kinase, partial [Rhodospirillaceae bacterium]
GCGKSTQAQLLADALTDAGHDVLLTREPGGSEGAEAIRKLLVEGAAEKWDGLTETLLHSAARRSHMVETVWPALNGGKTVICDRFFDSTLAYQGYGHGVDQEIIKTIHRAVVGDFAPDLTIVFTVPVDVGLERVAARGGTEMRYETMDKDFHERLRKGFLEIAESDPDRCHLVDAARDTEAVHRDVLAEVLWLLKEDEDSDE